MRKVVVLALAATLLAGCAAGPRLSPAERLDRYVSYAGEPISHFGEFGIDNWESLDTNRIVLWNGRKEAYLVTVWDTCVDLRDAYAIRVISSATSIVSKFDKIKVVGTPGSGPAIGGLDTCTIREIRPIDVRQMRADEEAIRKHREAAARDGG